MKHVILALLPATLAYKEFLWRVGRKDNCKSPPNLLTIYFNETISPFHEFWYQEYEHPTCGANPLVVDEGCCMVSYDLEGSSGFTNAMYSFSDTILWPAFPPSNYCYFEIEDKAKSILQDGECQMGARCFPNNTLMLYDDYDCANLVSADAATSMEISGGTVVPKWISVIPTSVLVASFEYPLEYFGMFCLIVALIVSVLLFIYYYMTMHAIPDAGLSLAIAKLLCIAFVIFRLCYWVIIYPDMISWVLVEWGDNVANNFSNLISAFTTLGALLKYFHVSNNRWIWFWKMLIVIIHLALAGNGYLVYWKYYGDYTNEMQYWNMARPVWRLLVFLFNTIPPLYMYSMIRKLRSKKGKSEKRKNQHEGYFIMLLCMQILNTVGHVYVQFATSYSDLLFNDHNFLAMSGPDSLIDVLDYALSYLVMISLVQMLHAHLHPNAAPLKMGSVVQAKIKSISQTWSANGKESAPTASLPKVAEVTASIKE